MNKRIVYNEIIKDFISLLLFALLIYTLVLIYISVPVMAGETKYDDDSKKNLDDPNVTYTIVGSGKERVNGNYFTVPKNKSSESEPIVIILDNVNCSQVDKSPDKSFITIEEGNSAEKQYYGTTSTDGTGWLKMEGEQVSFKDPGDINYEEEFTLELDDQHMPSGAKWEDITVSGVAELRSVVSDTSPGMSIVLAATGAGAYMVTARSHDGVENELYWNETINASFAGNTSKADPSPAESGEVSLAKLTSKGKNGLILTWTKVSEAEGYDIFFQRCSHGRKEKLIPADHERKLRYLSSNKKSCFSQQIWQDHR